MTSVNGLSRSQIFDGPHIARLLALALERLRLDLLRETTAAFPGLRASHLRLLELIPDEAARITDLAEVAGMNKQGVGYNVDYLRDRGYTAPEGLPDVRRVRLVRRTAKGDEAVAFTHG